MFKGYFESPVGVLEILGNDDYIYGVEFAEAIGEENMSPAIEQCKAELNEYFCGHRKDFTVKVQFEKGTEFQQKVWYELTRIPYGNKVSYKYMAEKVGNVKAVRAVGGANNKNPIAIIVPCHRVVGANGKLVGYAGGLDKKEFLLNLENAKYID